MPLLNRIFNFYINSNIHVALAVCSLVCITFIEFNLSFNYQLILFVFFATITGYNFVKYFGLAKFHHKALSNWLKQIQIFSFLSFLALCYFSFKLSYNAIIALSIMGVITFLYAIPFLPKTIFLDESKNLRAISGLKIYVIAFVWSNVTVIIPLINENYIITTDVILTALQRYLYVLVIMLPFEIRDVQFDSIKLSTIPQQIGVKLTKFIGGVFLIVLYCIEFFKTINTKPQELILLSVVLITGVLLFCSKVNQKQYYSSFIVESISILWLILILLSYFFS